MDGAMPFASARPGTFGNHPPSSTCSGHDGFRDHNSNTFVYKFAKLGACTGWMRVGRTGASARVCQCVVRMAELPGQRATAAPAYTRGVFRRAAVAGVRMTAEPNQQNALIVRAQQGEPDAIRQLALSWQPRVRNLVRYLVRGDDQVDDVAQQALLKAFEALPRYRGEGRIEAWLDGVVLRVTLRSMRRFRLLRSREVEHVEDSTRTAVWDAPRYVDRRKLALALDALPHKLRAAVVMHHVLGMSSREIAEVERIPEETARSRMRRGMAQLRTAFDPSSEVGES